MLVRGAAQSAPRCNHRHADRGRSNRDGRGLFLFTLGEWKLEAVILPLADVPAHIRASLALLPAHQLCFAVRLADGEVLDVGTASDLRRIVSCGTRLPPTPTGEA